MDAPPKCGNSVDAYSSLYWLDIEIKTGATLADLDTFLREVWLECCGHLSAFDIGQERYGGSHGLEAPGGFFDHGEKSLSAKIGDVLAPGMKFIYEYDFGSTAELTLKVTGEREGRIGPAPLRLLARNAPRPGLAASAGNRRRKWTPNLCTTKKTLFTATVTPRRRTTGC